MRVAILGAGGNMGRRISGALQGNDAYELRPIERSDRGRELLSAMGLTTMGQIEAFAGADVVIFAVPDRIVRDVAAEVVPLLDPGTSILFLDPAAVAAGRIPKRLDINCFVTHPTHPPLYSLLSEPDATARTDYWGGGRARQAIVFAVAWGDAGKAEAVEALVMDMFAPITTSHRVTVDQMAMLEPALTETLTNGCISLIHEGMERVIAAGVPEAATRDFLMGHLQIGIAIIFQQLDWKLSEGAAMALADSREQLFRDDWHRIFEPDAIMASLKQITGGD
ncbi:MAG: NAD(P)-binding domain-containing protein [Microbacteriaceae bacterium]|nr:NAD(P)-binding domain-containing protein [Microbacteriaceae bacterium]